MPTIARVHRKGQEGQAAVIKEFVLDERGENILILDFYTRICPGCRRETTTDPNERKLYCGDLCRYDFNNLAKKIDSTR